MPAEKDQLYPFPKQALVFRYLQCKSFENTAGKGEIARYEQFLLFPQCFIPLLRTSCYFHQIKNCRLQTLSVWTSLKFVVWESVKRYLHLQFFKKVKEKDIIRVYLPCIPNGVHSLPYSKKIIAKEGRQTSCKIIKTVNFK